MGRTELHHSTKYVCNNHKILSEHLPLSTLITTKILRYESPLIIKPRLHEKTEIVKDMSVLCTCLLNRFSVSTLFFAFTSFVFVLSIDTEEKLVNISLLPKDTGKSDVLPESLGLPLHLLEEEKTKCEVQKRNNKRKLSESEQVTHSLFGIHSCVLCSSTVDTLTFSLISKCD